MFRSTESFNWPSHKIPNFGTKGVDGYRRIIEDNWPTIVVLTSHPAAGKAKVCLQLQAKAAAYADFCGMKQLGIFLLHPGWDACPSQGYPAPASNSPVPIYTPGKEKHSVGQLSVLPKPHTHNIPISPARARTRTTRSGVERT